MTIVDNAFLFVLLDTSTFHLPLMLHLIQLLVSPSPTFSTSTYMAGAGQGDEALKPWRVAEGRFWWRQPSIGLSKT